MGKCSGVTVCMGIMALAFNSIVVGTTGSASWTGILRNGTASFEEQRCLYGGAYSSCQLVVGLSIAFLILNLLVLNAGPCCGFVDFLLTGAWLFLFWLQLDGYKSSTGDAGHLNVTSSTANMVRAAMAFTFLSALASFIKAFVSCCSAYDDGHDSDDSPGCLAPALALMFFLLPFSNLGVVVQYVRFPLVLNDTNTSCILGPMAADKHLCDLSLGVSSADIVMSVVAVSLLLSQQCCLLGNLIGLAMLTLHSVVASLGVQSWYEGMVETGYVDLLPGQTRFAAESVIAISFLKVAAWLGVMIGHCVFMGRNGDGCEVRNGGRMLCVCCNVVPKRSAIFVGGKKWKPTY